MYAIRSYYEFQGFFVQFGLIADALEFPSADVTEVFVVAHGFAVIRLMLDTEMTTASYNFV